MALLMGSVREGSPRNELAAPSSVNYQALENPESAPQAWGHLRAEEPLSCPPHQVPSV